VLLALVLAASPLSDAMRDYADLDYESCVAKLAAVRSLPAKERAQADLMLGLCHFALGHEAVARAHLEAALRRDPSLPAPPNASPKERALLDEIAAAVAAAPPPEHKRPSRHGAEPPRAPRTEPPATASREEARPAEPAEPADAEPAATPEPTATRPADAPTVAPALTPAAPAPTPLPIVTAPPERRPTWVPFVVGGLAVAAAGTGAAFGLNAKIQESAGRAAPVQLDADRLRTDAQTSATVANVAFAVAGTAAIAAVITFIALR